MQKCLLGGGHQVGYCSQTVCGNKSSLSCLCILSVCLKLKPESKMTDPRSLLETGSDLIPGSPASCLPLHSTALPNLEKDSLLRCAVSQSRDGIGEVGDP